MIKGSFIGKLKSASAENHKLLSMCIAHIPPSNGHRGVSNFFHLIRKDFPLNHTFIPRPHCFCCHIFCNGYRRTYAPYRQRIQ